jgi:hypothetical protein
LLGGAVDQRDAPVEPGRDDAAAHGLHDIFVQRLQIFERAARVFQLHIHLAQLAHQQAGQIGDGKVGEEVDEDHYLQRLELGMGSRIGGNHEVVIEFENGSEENESQGRAQVSPGPRQQHAGDHDDQGVEEIQRAVDAAGEVDDQRDHGQIGEHLQNGLQRCSFQTETRKRKNSESTNHSTMPVRKGMMGSGLGVRRMTASSMASRTIRIRMRTFTSQVSQFRSSEMECMRLASSVSVVSRLSFAFVVRCSLFVVRGCGPNAA